MKINTKNDEVIFEPENEYDVFLLGILFQKFNKSQVDFKSDNFDKFTKVQNLKCHKDVLLFYLEHSMKEKTNNDFKRY